MWRIILKNSGGQDTTLKIVVEPFGLRTADVARPPPRVGVARRALQHSRPGSHRGAAALSPLLFLLRVVGRTLAATW